jgi:zinc transport system permease protein
MSFLEALFNPSMPFLRNALLAALLSSVLFGLLGTIVTVKRIASLAGAISHAVLGGIGLALYLSSNQIIPNFSPMAGAIIFALLAAFTIGLVSMKGKQRIDTVINAIWAIGMSLGVLFMAKSRGYTDPTSYLFGNILLVSSGDLILMAILDVVLIVLIFLFYPQIESTSFDDEFAQVKGISPTVVFMITLSVTAVAIVLLQTYVGIVMVIAMLTLPAGTASFSSKNMGMMMLLAYIYATLFSVGGLVIGWKTDLPVGAMVVVIAGVIFLLFSLFAAVKKRKRKVQ